MSQKINKYLIYTVISKIWFFGDVSDNQDEDRR